MIPGPAFAIGALLALILLGRQEDAKDYNGLYGGKNPFASSWQNFQDKPAGCC